MALIAAGIAGGLGAAGNIAGGAMAGGADPFRGATDVPFVYPETTYDPLMVALSLMGLGNVGVGGNLAEQILQQQSPYNQVLAIIGSSAENIEKKRMALAVLQDALRGGEITGKKRQTQTEKRFLAEAGFGSLAEFVTAQQAFEADLPAQIEQMNAQIAPMQQAMQTGQLKLGELISDYPMVTQENIDAVRAAEEARLAQGFETQREQLVQQANLLGFNPAQGLGEIAQAQELSDLQALQSALGLLSGQQTIAGQSLQGLQSALYTPQELLMNISNLRQTGVLGSAGVAAQQIGALAGAGAQSAATQQQAAAEFGTGIASGVSGLGSALGQGYFLYQNPSLVKQLTTVPGLP